MVEDIRSRVKAKKFKKALEKLADDLNGIAEKCTEKTE